MNTLQTRDEGIRLAKRVAAEQHVPGDSALISYQDEKGQWHEEMSQGDDRPDADVVG